MKARFLTILPIISLLTGCMNMPTPPIEITATYVTPVTYETMTCKQLFITMNALKEQETNLVFAQTQRIKDSKVQAFWWGTGKGDGIAAPEIAQTKGKIVAVEKAVKKNNCRQR